MTCRWMDRRSSTMMYRWIECRWCHHHHHPICRKPSEQGHSREECERVAWRIVAIDHFSRQLRSQAMVTACVFRRFVGAISNPIDDSSRLRTAKSRIIEWSAYARMSPKSAITLKANVRSASCSSKWARSADLRGPIFVSFPSRFKGLARIGNPNPFDGIDRHHVLTHTASERDDVRIVNGDELMK